ncbi:MAG: ABC transporter ATP-binding protein [Thermotogae bacterium]|nr:ABC transporter ATP-binding protein [Thermotogota bacterium]MCP5465734.1 ABC transporter ATP-binding protein [Thermotogota bacterium]HOO73736.1 ABC transporter ATP-binding protein [Tepiditoga sp.]
MKAIETLNLSKAFKKRKAVDGLTLSIEKGEFFALLGQNGAGKTTTIKILCGLSKPTEGKAFVLGKDVSSDDSFKEKINVSPQETAVAPNLSVYENLKFIAEIYGNKRNAASEKAENMIKYFSLSERRNDKAKTLSGGMQRKLSIAMALITDPEVLFLDEPTLGLDVRARRELWEKIKTLKGKVTIILTTHYLEEAEALADRICIMNRGRISEIGTVQELKEKTGKDNFEDVFLMLTEQEDEL